MINPPPPSLFVKSASLTNNVHAVWTIFVLTFLIASLPTNLVYILIFTFVDLAFLVIAASYFALADGHATAAVGLKKTGGVFCFLAGLVGWYVAQCLLGGLQLN